MITINQKFRKIGLLITTISWVLFSAGQMWFCLFLVLCDRGSIGQNDPTYFNADIKWVRGEY